MILELVRYIKIKITDTCKLLNYFQLSSFKDNKPFIGTTRYASVAAHKGYELGRKDDIESLIYVMLYLLRG